MAVNFKRGRPKDGTLAHLAGPLANNATSCSALEPTVEQRTSACPNPTADPKNEYLKRQFQYGIARDVTASNCNEYVVIQLVNSDDNGSYVCYIYDVNSDGATAVNWFTTKKLMKDLKFKKRDKYVTFPKDAILLPNYEVMDVDKFIRTSTSSDVIAFQKVSSCRAHSYFLTR